jgi:DNA-binding SARP family transcriptional activator
MRVDILGPIQVTQAEQNVPLAGRHQHGLVAILASEADRVIPADRLIDALWADRPPATARTKLQGYVSGVRKALNGCRPGGRDSRWPLVTLAPGYLLSTDGVTVDLSEYRVLIRLADGELGTGQLGHASRNLGNALALWRGPAFAGLTSPAFLGMAAALERGRLLTIERKAKCDLLLGRYDTVADELSPVLAAHPLSEHARAELMLAMYRLGSRAEALELYRVGRRALRDEVGIEPGRLLRRLHNLMLVDDPQLHANDPLAQIMCAAGDGTLPAGGGG